MWSLLKNKIGKDVFKSLKVSLHQVHIPIKSIFGLLILVLKDGENNSIA